MEKLDLTIIVIFVAWAITDIVKAYLKYKSNKK